MDVFTIKEVRKGSHKQLDKLTLLIQVEACENSIISYTLVKLSGHFKILTSVMGIMNFDLKSNFIS